MGRITGRLYRYGLLTLLVVTLATVVLVKTFVLPAARQRSAAAAIKELGGFVIYDFQQAGENEPRGPKWLRQLIGNDYFQTVAALYFDRSLFEQGKIAVALDVAATIPHLESLGIECPMSLDDVCVEKIASLHLKHLRLIGDGVNDAQLQHIGLLTKLQTLYLEGPFTDAGLPALTTLVNLRTLGLNGDVTDAGVIQLAPLTRLEHFGCNYDNHVFNMLGHATSLECKDCPICDAVRFLAEYANIKVRFDDSAISAAGIDLDVPLTENQTQVPLRWLLERVLKPNHLGYLIDKDTLVVTTQRAVDDGHLGIEQLQKTLPNLNDVTVGW